MNAVFDPVAGFESMVKEYVDKEGMTEKHEPDRIIHWKYPFLTDK